MIKNTMKTTVLLATLGGLIVTVAGVLGGGSSTALVIGLGISGYVLGQPAGARATTLGSRSVDACVG